MLISTAAPAPAAPVRTAPIDPRAWRVLAVSAAGVFVVFLDATVVNIAFPAITAEFPHVGRAGLSWVLNAYAVVFGALLVTSGRLADDRGRKRVFQAGLVTFAAASALCGLAPSVPLLVAARALQAVGAALLVPASLALLLPEFPLARRGLAVGLWGAVGGVAAATGPSLGALLVQGPGWRWVFYVNLPFCSLAWLAGRRVLSESTGTPSGARPDVAGVVGVTLAFALLSLGLVEGPEWGWWGWRVTGALGIGLLLLPVVAVRALRHPAPVLPVRLFCVPSFSLACAATLLFAAAFFANLLCSVLFLTGVWHYPVLRTALAVMPGPLLAAAVSAPAGRLADRFGYRAVIVPGCALFAAGQLWFVSHAAGQPHYLADLLPGLLCVGVAIGLAFPTLGAAGAQALPAHQFAAGSAVVATARQMGAVLGISVLVAVLGHPGRAQLVPAFHHAWTAIGLAAVGAGGVAAGLRRS